MRRIIALLWITIGWIGVNAQTVRVGLYHDQLVSKSMRDKQRFTLCDMSYLEWTV